MSGREIRIDVDLGIDRSTAPQRLIDTQGVPYKSFTVIATSSGALFELGAGQGAPLFPYGTGDRWQLDDMRCDAPVTDGIYIKNDPQAGATLILQVGFGAERSTGND